MLIIQPHGVRACRIGYEKPGCDPAHGNKPFCICGVEVEGTGPDVLLIFGEMDQELALVRMGNRVKRGRVGGLRLRRLLSRGWSSALLC